MERRSAEEILAQNNENMERRSAEEILAQNNENMQEIPAQDVIQNISHLRVPSPNFRHCQNLTPIFHSTLAPNPSRLPRDHSLQGQSSYLTVGNSRRVEEHEHDVQ